MLGNNLQQTTSANVIFSYAFFLGALRVNSCRRTWYFSIQFKIVFVFSLLCSVSLCQLNDNSRSINTYIFAFTFCLKTYTQRHKWKVQSSHKVVQTPMKSIGECLMCMVMVAQSIPQWLSGQHNLTLEDEGVARTLKKLRTSKGDYCIKQ